MTNLLILEELQGCFGDDLTDVEPETLIGIYDRESHDTLRISLPTVVAAGLETRAYDEHRTTAEIVFLALIQYFQNPIKVKPRPES